MEKKPSPNKVDVNQVFQAAIKAGLVKGEATLAQVAEVSKTANISTDGYAVAWDKYVAVIK